MAAREPMKATLLIFEDDFIRVGHLINGLSVNDRDSCLRDDFCQALNFASLSNIPQNSVMLCDKPEVTSFSGKGAICEYIRIVIGKRGATSAFKRRLAVAGRQIVSDYISTTYNPTEAVSAATTALAVVSSTVPFKETMMQGKASISILVLPAKRRDPATVDVFLSKSNDNLKYAIVTAQDFEAEDITQQHAIASGLSHCFFDCAVRCGSISSTTDFIERLRSAPFALYPTPEVRYVETQVLKRTHSAEEMEAATLLAKAVGGKLYKMDTRKPVARTDFAYATTNT